MYDAPNALSVITQAPETSVLPQRVMDAIAPLTWVAASVYVLAVGLLALYGLHSLWLLVLFLRNRRQAAAQAAAEAVTPLPADAELPHVLVQLPVFNERDVVNRLMEAIGRLDWPRDRLHIQLLDDSTDDSVVFGRDACAKLRDQGLDAVHLHRTLRTGFKAGALEHGMQHCDAPFIAIFDADFIPNPDFLRIAIKPLLADPGLCLVQGRWEHVNRDDNLLTRAQAVGIDGHFAVEQGARAWSGLPMNFNGTCGMWRREAIIAAGGWEHDTLTEDMDLSYRAQLVGWRCTYRIGLGVPGEVPADVNAWRSQQFRWAKGSIQTAIKLLPRVWASSWDLHKKLSASLHMTHYLVHPLILASLFAAPLALLLVERGAVPMWVLMLGIASFVIGATSPIAVYVTSQLALHGKAGWRNLRALPPLAAIGTGIAVSNATAVWQAVRGKQSAFVRTPKAGGKGTTGSYRARAHSGYPEMLCALWAVLGITLGYIGHHTWVTPLLAIYLSGFAWMSWHCIRERRARERAAQVEAVPQTA
jgi:cellulose synthase/poly-beta-1,6-N-acetylglucosamine synthase-like glycosyltransferase